MKRMTFVLFVLLVFGAQLIAQETEQAPTTQDTATAKKTMKEDGQMAAERALRDLTVESPLRGAIPQLSFTIDQDKQKGAAQFGFTRGDQAWSITLSGPVNEGSAKTTLATSDGLETGTTAEFAWKNTFFDLSRDLPTAAQITNACQTLAKPKNCTRDTLPERDRLMFDQMVRFPPTWTFGFSGKVGRQSFEFSDPTTLADGSEEHTGRSISASAGVFGRLIYFTSLTYKRSTAWRAGSAASICTPLGPGLRCRDTILGAPTKKTSDIVQLELRDFIGKRYAVTPRFSYEREQEAFSVEVPVYMRDGEEPFNGGVSFGWDNKQKDFVISLFVGALPKLKF